MPERIRAFCHFGKTHDIEVEDDVTAYAEYANGATGVFITSTGEAPEYPIAWKFQLIMAKSYWKVERLLSGEPACQAVSF